MKPTPSAMGRTGSNDSKNQQEMTRRSYLKSIVVGVAAAIFGCLWALRQHFKSLGRSARVVARVGEIPVGGLKIFQYPTPQNPCILIRTSEENYIAYSRICTHASCPIFYRPERHVLECPCHGGVFSLADGSVLAGPPPRPLPRILLKIRGEDIVATGFAKTS